ncbi:MAG: tungstate ABC transporter ATP-binding protein WtpC [Methanocellales archaeon]|nr:tungstate ABC transporter ATP-binding protein WtpC [Methanocellales archaeon]MDD3291679.1 tungstate ABC transporter ATP-binding protein WtpC [Methanocellales archaeon]MDD5235029.1 tungstate ABC transporter ATP-binding protein WtpC [Methanocellales archaeon]MDD5485167.1 tungstate ABC transporter ATP-binding protein WtpC [Methanocellales archaeon]
MIQIEGVSKDLGEFFLRDVDLEIYDNEYFVILGPTGAGKSVLLETLAGIYRPEKGRIFIDDQNITYIPPRKRNIGMVYQDYTLFPFLTVEENIAFGLKLRKMNKIKIKRKVEELEELLHISHLANRYPDTLSGGEQQKVAIARAIAIEPPILLLDEPLSALDTRTRKYLREELKRIKKELDITMVHVTHDQTEAMFLADRIGIMMDGEIVQVGTPREIFNEPINERVAEFVGVENILEGVIESNEDGITIVSIKGHRIEAVSNYSVGDKVRLCLRPEDITLVLSRDKSSARNSFKGMITQIVPLGALIQVNVNCSFPIIALVTKRSLEDIGLKEGDEVIVSFKATAIHILKQ